MSRHAGRNPAPAFKAQMALAAVKGNRTWLSLPSSSTCIPTTRSHRGRRSLKALRRICAEAAIPLRSLRST
jgi:hypothetical protein